MWIVWTALDLVCLRLTEEKLSNKSKISLKLLLIISQASLFMSLCKLKEGLTSPLKDS